MGDDNRREYIPRLDIEAIERASDNIRIVADRDEDSEGFKRAHELIVEAISLIIIGFGFDETNMSRLKIKEHFKGKKIYCTSHGFENAEKDAKIRKQLDGTPGFLRIDSDGDRVPLALRKMSVFE